MRDVVKLGPVIPIPSCWLDGLCYRCGADDADEKLVDVLVGGWFCKRHHDDDLAAMGRLILGAFDRLLEEPGEVLCCAGRSAAAHPRTPMTADAAGWTCSVCGERDEP